MTPRARAVAFYLPQFHPIPENDRFWGEGFTEWTNVRRARPLFPGHDQPVEPGELGYYDLRDPGARAAQAALASQHGVEAFCWWHYWFAGRRVLERPFDEVLRSGEPGLSFCLGWANHSWTGVWQGAPGRVLLEQTYPGPHDDAAHFRAVLPALRDERALRVEGRPVFVLFDPGALPDLRGFVAHWRHLARAAGLPGLFFVGLRSSEGPAWDDLDATASLTPDRLMARSSLRSTLAALGPART
ncbi:MAG TPA: glycoside hydrolase family 99-like domain-containing protein, partial [Myxococcota bacterium]|nr:glycoside hydrolase family 99-like domain-containing protein [Myxococcota bacterium]